MIETKDFPELKFDEGRHIYCLNGIIIPSVTTVMRPLSEAHYSGINEAVLNRAAGRGNAVHNAIDNLVRFDILDISPEFSGYLTAFQAWMRDYEVKPLATETRTYHKLLRYAGTADMGCEERGINTLVDFKTTSVVAPMLCGVQLEAYKRAQESHGVKYDQEIIVQLKNDGTYKRHTQFPPRVECWKVFGSLLNVYGFSQNYK